MARDVTGSNIGLSFIDVLASALGAAVLLFVILASTPPQVSSRAKAVGTFIRYEWRVAKDPNALLRIKVYPPDAPNAPYWTDPDATAGSAVIRCRAGANSILVVGFSPDSGHDDGTGNRTYVLRLNGIGSGPWRVGLLYYDRIGSDFSKPPPIQVTPSRVGTDSRSHSDGTAVVVRATNASGPAPSVSADKPVTLQYADELKSPATEEPDKRENLCSKG